MIEFDERDGLVPPQFHRSLGKRTGLLGTLYYKPPYRGAPVAYQTANRRCDIEYLVGYHGEIELSASGKGIDIADSMTSCIGESLERYSMCWPDESEMVRSSYDELAETETVVDFDYLSIFDEGFREQFLEPFTRETELLWTPGTNLLTGEEVYVPAEYVWMRVGPLEGEPRHVIGSSNGVAAGPSLEEALLWAMYERVERDGIMRTWWQGRSPARIDVDADPELRAYVDEHLPHDDLSMQLFECESIVDVPTYGSAFVNANEEYPKFAIAGSADVDPDAALLEAATEVLQGWPYLHDIAVQYDIESIDIDEVIGDFTRNVLYYAYPDNFEDARFLFDGPERPPATDRYPDVDDWSVEKRTGYLLERLDEAGCTPIAFDLTSRDVRACGTYVARVFVPELVGLTPPAAAPTDHPSIDADRVIDKPHPFP